MLVCPSEIKTSKHSTSPYPSISPSSPPFLLSTSTQSMTIILTTKQFKIYHSTFTRDFKDFQLVYVVGPLFTKYTSILGVRISYLVRFFLTGLTFIIMGLLRWVDDLTSFLILSYIFGIMEGCGIAAQWNSNLNLSTSLFPDNQATVEKWLVCSRNIGLTFGPVFGPFLYDAGGYGVPLLVTGAGVIICGAVVFVVMAKPCCQQSSVTVTWMHHEVSQSHDGDHHNHDICLLLLGIAGCCLFGSVMYNFV